MSLQKPSTPSKLIKYQDLHSLMDRQNHQTEPAVQQGADLTYAATTSQSCVTKYRAQTAIPRDSSPPLPLHRESGFQEGRYQSVMPLGTQVSDRQQLPQNHNCQRLHIGAQ